MDIRENIIIILCSKVPNKKPWNDDWKILSNVPVWGILGLECMRCYMLQSRIRLTTVFHATCYKNKHVHSCRILQWNWNSFELGSILIWSVFEIYKHKNNTAKSRNMEDYDDNMSGLSEEESSFGNQVNKIKCRVRNWRRHSAQIEKKALWRIKKKFEEKNLEILEGCWNILVQSRSPSAEKPKSITSPFALFVDKNWSCWISEHSCLPKNDNAHYFWS